MISAVFMILAVIWVYQSAVKAGVPNLLMWVGIAAGIFLASQFLLVNVNVYLLEAFRGGEGDVNYERDLASIGDRKNEGGFQNMGGSLLSIFYELMPPVVGFLLVAFFRLKFIVKEAFSMPALFGGFKEMFVKAGQDAFKTMKESVVKPKEETEKKSSDPDKPE